MLILSLFPPPPPPPQIPFSNGLGTKYDFRKSLHIAWLLPCPLLSRYHVLPRRPARKEPWTAVESVGGIMKGARGRAGWEQIYMENIKHLLWRGHMKLLKIMSVLFPLLPLWRCAEFPASDTKFWTVQINPEKNGSTAASCLGKERNPMGLLRLRFLVSHCFLFSPCSSPISIPYPVGVSMATPRKAMLPSDMGEMLNGWKELAWENLEIQLKIGKAIMEGDGGKLPGDFKPFWRSHYRLNAICCFSFTLMRRKKDFCFLVRCEGSLAALSLHSSLLLAVILLILS